MTERPLAPSQIVEQQKKMQAITGGLTPDQYAEKLLMMRAKLTQRHAFNVGDLITPKKDLNDFNIPYMGYPVVVDEILETPIIDPQPLPQHSRFQRKYDMVVLAWIEGTLLPFYTEKCRFEPWKGH